MSNWRELGDSNRHAAVRLHADERSARPSVSRAYYAVYHELTHQLATAGFQDFGENDGKLRKNPNHAKLANLAGKNIAGLSRHNSKELRKAVTRLRERRVDADYRPGNTVDTSTAKEALRDMLYALGILSRAKGGV